LRKAHENVWESVVLHTNALTGQVSHMRHRFVELASGINFIDPLTGQFEPTREEFQITPEGFAVAQFGPAKLIVEKNLNSPSALEILAGDGVRLRAGPIAVGYFDPVDGKNLILATIQNCAGELTGPAEITSKKCFDRLDASIRISYRRSGISQDLILHAAPPAPEDLGLSVLSRLEIYTAFTPDSPLPVKTERILRGESDPVLRQQMVDPDFTDEILDWGQYKMASGTAVEWSDGQATGRIPVAKRFSAVGNSGLLIEAVEWREARKLFAGMPQARNAADIAGAAQARRASFSTIDKKQLMARAIPLRPATSKEMPSIQTASLSRSAGPAQPSFVLDYSLVTGATNVTLLGNTTSR
jgi:hypothetical protein